MTLSDGCFERVLRRWGDSSAVAMIAVTELQFQINQGTVELTAMQQARVCAQIGVLAQQHNEDDHPDRFLTNLRRLFFGEGLRLMRVSPGFRFLFEGDGSKRFHEFDVALHLALMEAAEHDVAAPPAERIERRERIIKVLMGLFHNAPPAVFLDAYEAVILNGHDVVTYTKHQSAWATRLFSDAVRANWDEPHKVIEAADQELALHYEMHLRGDSADRSLAAYNRRTVTLMETLYRNGTPEEFVERFQLEILQGNPPKRKPLNASMAFADMVARNWHNTGERYLAAACLSEITFRTRKGDLTLTEKQRTQVEERISLLIERVEREMLQQQAFILLFEQEVLNIQWPAEQH